MASLLEQAIWVPSVYRIETTDLVIGGESGTANKSIKQLANRTNYLKQNQDDLLIHAGSVDNKIASLDSNNLNFQIRLGLLEDAEHAPLDHTHAEYVNIAQYDIERSLDAITRPKALWLARVSAGAVSEVLVSSDAAFVAADDATGDPKTVTLTLPVGLGLITHTVLISTSAAAMANEEYFDAVITDDGTDYTSVVLTLSDSPATIDVSAVVSVSVYQRFIAVLED